MKLFKKFTALTMSLAVLFAFTTPVFVSAATGSSDAACQAISVVNPTGACDSKAQTGSTLSKVIKLILNLLSLVAGVIAVIMLIVGGLKYITSQGDASSAASARNTLLYAIIGLVIVVFAQMIVKFVLKKSAGV